MTADVDKLVAIAADEVATMARLARIGTTDTAGPDHPPEIVDVVSEPHPCWVDGWWAHATRHPAHPARIGGPISPFAVVWHSCDMLPEEFDALIVAYTTKPGAGNAATFLIGPTPVEGVVQFCPITRNANHAGGKGHGVFLDNARREYHPNLAAIGIEIHCAGGVRLVAGEWRLVEGGVAHGRPIPSVDVISDPQRPDRGWHRVTDYQYERAAALRADLELVLAPAPAGLIAKSVVELAPSWALTKNGRDVGHVTLDAANRSDPWPPTMAWLRNRS